MWQDLKFGLRMFRTNPGLSAAAVFTLALGIASSATVFSWIDGLLLHPFGSAHGDGDMAVMDMVLPGTPNGGNQVSWLDALDYKRDMKTLAGVALHHEDVFHVGGPSNGQVVWGELVSGDYFSVLGVRPVAGRTFNLEENGTKLGAYPVAVISHRLWRQRFGENPAAIGQTIRVNRRELTIVGVAPEDFRGGMPGLAFDIWIPVTMGTELGVLDKGAFQSRGARNLYAHVRLKPGVTVLSARAEAATVSRNLQEAYPKSNKGVLATVLPLWEFRSAGPELLAKPLRVLMGISILVLLVACANVANLLLVRSFDRRREWGVRLAMGANASRLARQLMVETMVLAAASAFGGLLMAYWMADLLPALVPKVHASVAMGLQLSWRILGFTSLVCVAAAMLSAAAPLLFLYRTDVNGILKDSSRGGTASAQSMRLRGLLAGGEVALAALAVTGAGIFIRSFQNATTMDPGFDRTNVVLARFYLPATGMTTKEMQDFCLGLQNRLRAMPGVTSATYSDYPPLGASRGPYSTLEIEGFPTPKEETPQVNRFWTGPGYQAAMKTPVVEGRDFDGGDSFDAPPVAMVNQSFAKRFFHGESPLGRKIKFNGKWATVVGLVKDSKYFHIVEASRPHFFAPFRQQAGSDGQLYFFVRATGDPASVMAGFRAEVAGVNVNAGAFDLMMLRDWTEITLLPQRAAAGLTTGMGLISLLLAAIGLYSVMSYAVTQRQHEIGVRMALGAGRINVLSDVLRRGLSIALPGVAAGMAGGFVAMKVASGLLIRVRPEDPATYLAAGAFLALVAVVACLLPAQRAARVNPINALRCE
jgi:predicted permease